MDYSIERITIQNYPLFEDMVFRRGNGFDRETSETVVPEVSDTVVPAEMEKALADPDLYVYALRKEDRYVGWISLVYIPKLGSRWKGHGHVYVDELWVDPAFRGRGYAKALMKKADELKTALEATGIRLYVNVNNPAAENLYERCGYLQDGQAIMMEKK